MAARSVLARRTIPASAPLRAAAAAAAAAAVAASTSAPLEPSKSPAAAAEPPSLLSRVRPIVEVFAEELPAVRRAYVRTDGAEFILLGSALAPELGASAARLSLALQRAFAPDFSPYIEGGYEATANRPLDGYVLVFERA
jgi:hypothetical protein